MSEGTRYNQGKLRWRNFPLFLFEEVVAVGSKAEKHKDNPDGKYDTFNFLKGLKMNDTLDSLKRHLMKFESPYESDFDEESKLNHLAHVAWNALVALHFYKTRPDLDDRYKIEKSATEKAIEWIDNLTPEQIDKMIDEVNADPVLEEVLTHRQDHMCMKKLNKKCFCQKDNK